eukprot:CAMPEP_0117421480 /NCGR_PEP_ID=MMETSP0758-20121206/2557_1 /TAXON_ID=63605 /ORGANISM="Percolomonas cosmopolitus, Strain AE-1 (ATCC 50343)" /LENGTH=665 /DNA_ID=CAMNT_0005203617 /DNA_START=57 /DNA_END=2051 /DNA_ORIENTATION=+
MTTDGESLGMYSEYTESIQSEEPNIYERIQQKKRAKTKKPTKKRVHFSKQLAETRQERALERYEQMRKEWGRIESHLSENSGKPSHSLIMQRSASDHRQKLEESHIIDASIPVENRGGAERWEMSLRKSRPTDVGIKMVRVGGLWPYPLYCPVKDKTTREMETIRQTVVTEGVDASERRSVLGVRTMHNPYVKQHYKSYIETYMDHDPEEHMNDLQVIGVNYEAFHDEQSRQFSQSKPWLETYAKDEGNMMPPDASDLQSEFDRTEALDIISGPSFSVNTTQLTSLLRIPGDLAHQEVTMVNEGSVALQFRFEKKQADHAHAAARSRSLFHCTSTTSGIVLPGDNITFSFTFSSMKEGVFTEDWLLHTIPYHRDPVVIQLTGTLVVDRVNDKEVALNALTSSRVPNALLQHHLHALVDTMPLPDAPYDDQEDRAAADRAQRLSLFRSKNANYAPVVFINDALLRFIEQFAASLGLSSFDYSLQSLQSAVTLASSKDRPRAMRTFDDIFFLVTTDFNSSAWNYGEDNTFLDRLFFARAKRLFSTSLETLLDQCDAIDARFRTLSSSSDATSKKKDAKKKGAAAAPVLSEEEARLLAEKQQLKADERTHHQLQMQGAEVVSNMMSSILSCWQDAEDRFSSFDPHEEQFGEDPLNDQEPPNNEEPQND